MNVREPRATCWLYCEHKRDVFKYYIIFSRESRLKPSTRGGARSTWNARRAAGLAASVRSLTGTHRPRALHLVL